MPRPARDERVRVMDVHAEPVASQAWDFFFTFFDHVERMGKHVVVEGGWAVAAHGSPVPSVDLDIIVRQEELDADRDFYDLLHGEGRFRREQGPSMLDWQFLDMNRAWASAAGYHRAALLEARTEPETLAAPDGRTKRIVIPTLPTLLAMKLKAFRDRNLQFRVMRDPAEIASYDPNDIAVVHPSEDYRLRKAAKDLVDIGYLWAVASESQRAEVTALLQTFGLARIVRKALLEPDPLVVSAADYLIGRHAMPGTAAATLEAMLRRLP